MGTPREVLKVLHYDGIVILPTETVYGLAARADRPNAVRRIYDIKGRDFDKPLALCVSSLDIAKQYGDFSRIAQNMAKKFWPGPLTLVVPAATPTFFNQLAPQMYAKNSKGEPTIAIRCPDVEWRTRIQNRGLEYPVALTSANRSGGPDPISAKQASEAIGVDVDDIWYGPDCDAALPSTIVTLAEGSPKVLREGALPLKALKQWKVTSI
ncbi:tRNA threonylcarbamoyl adenosine modification protein (Sua5/YciO/YrdC/YwlC family) [Litorimonas taeanensis]|uniref:L-threonylcarbamoyladenylate synthase n=1 Tax=Litorimonas taeanensis TaxID=568099 RepID=A0A420WIJ1_9PROT|nr:L-threonylcarbamoyladenylate synthase [Litorimonas taeanensis]RKQ70844.1 tRNA threonylcarbamoyl adenosine modification protein (Sua5/YciO/YrdC/YwlC family) [Litorimonas taeanensis]